MSDVSHHCSQSEQQLHFLSGRQQLWSQLCHQPHQLLHLPIMQHVTTLDHSPGKGTHQTQGWDQETQ